MHFFSYLPLTVLLFTCILFQVYSVTPTHREAIQYLAKEDLSP